MLLDTPTRTALKCIKALRGELVFYKAKEKSEDILEEYTSKIWALDQVEDLIYRLDKPPLEIIENFTWKMRAYSGLNKIFNDCWVEMELLIDFLTAY